MINSLKTVAFFGCRLTSRYRKSLVEAFNDAAEEAGINLVYFYSIGEIGDANLRYAQNELQLIDFIDLDQFDGIIFDGEGYRSTGILESIIKILRKASCPVVSISSCVEGFINLKFEDATGMRLMLEHFLDVHKFTKIGFMSGIPNHPDAEIRLKEFRTVMSSRGLPENGVGIFDGDFWFEKGDEAADYFLSLPERPEAVVCANDYMAISLISALKKRGVEVPGDIAVSGYDGSVDGQEFFPKITTATRERKDIAKRSLSLILDIIEGKDHEHNLHVFPRAVIEQSCGCGMLEYKPQLELSKMFSENRSISYHIRLSESALLRLSFAETVDDIGKVFATHASNFGEFNCFYLSLYSDKNGKLSFDSAFSEKSDKLVPVIKIDKNDTFSIPENGLNRSCIIPDCTENKPQFFYVMSVHSTSRLFGCSIVSMNGHEIYNEFYTLWIMNMAMMLGNMLKTSRIDKLIGSLKELSTKDDLTGMFNRRGFDVLSHEIIDSLTKETTICTIVIDMDGLKTINDEHGHHEGDIAIKAAGDIISECSDSGEISARTGGDEFYVFAADYSPEKLLRFIERLEKYVRVYNLTCGKPYELSLSYGTYLTKADSNANLEECLKISDTRMYKQKLSKPNRR